MVPSYRRELRCRTPLECSDHRFRLAPRATRDYDPNRLPFLVLCRIGLHYRYRIAEKLVVKTKRAGAGDENGSPPRAQPLDVGRIGTTTTISSPDAMPYVISNYLSDNGLALSRPACGAGLYCFDTTASRTTCVTT